MTTELTDGAKDRHNSSIRAQFEAALERIAAETREPTDRELNCLYSALAAMAIGNDLMAEAMILGCFDASQSALPSWTPSHEITLKGLKEGLAALPESPSPSARLATMPVKVTIAMRRAGAEALPTEIKAQDRAAVAAKVYRAMRRARMKDAEAIRRNENHN